MSSTAPAAPRPRRWRRLLRWLLWALAALLAALLLYLGLAWLLSRWAVPGEPQVAAGSVEIGLLTSPVHTDVLLPLQHEHADWATWLPRAAFPGAVAACTHVAIGWGDRGFFLEAPTWADLRLGTALVAISGVGRAAMHVEFLPDLDWPAQWPGNTVQRVRIDAAHYRRLVEFVQGAFARTATGQPVPIAARGYSYDGRDAFFEALGHYSLVRTCNVWTTAALRAAGLPTPLWSPFPGAVGRFLPEAR
ncbi:MAG: TIGR02117 family protein [Planctomycetes bacterium]|nr:TIGR02117 family protein [Planctomycetota bacterium]